MKFSEIPFQTYVGPGVYGVRAVLNYPNGYELSIVKIFDELYGNSHGAEEDLYEAALLKGGEMCYDTHITGFEKKIIGFLSEPDIEKLIREVQKL